MIPVVYLRSSSLNTWESCQHQYYIEYVLGWKGDSNKAADKGTIVHKVLEILAVLKKKFQDTKENYVQIIDDTIGDVDVSWDEFIEETTLTAAEISFINKTRKNKYNYGEDEKKYLKAGHKRLGVNFLEDIIRRVYDYYSEKYDRDWQPVDFKDCTNWVWMALDGNNRNYDPRLRNIVQPEQQFEIEIDAPWASYYYDLPEGELLGKVKLKGTIDLITEIDDSFYEIVDWKTGQRKNWTTGEIKTYEKLQKDTQLLFYNYAIRKLYPDMQHVMLTINFIRGCNQDLGGAATLVFDDSDLKLMEKKLSDTIRNMHECKRPKLLDKTRRKQFCTFCYFNKKKDRQGVSLCESIHQKIKDEGIENVTKRYMKKFFKLGTYSAPGGE